MLAPQNIFYVDLLHLENESFNNVENCLGFTRPYKVQNLSVWSQKLKAENKDSSSIAQG